MASVLQGSWALGYLVAAVLYATMFDVIGWRGMLWIGVLPALAVVWIRFYVKEPEVWVENQKLQKANKTQIKVPIAAIFRKGMRLTTLSTCWWLISAFTVYYSIFGLFATYMTKELHLSAAAVGWPLAFSNGLTFLFSFLWGTLADSIGRRWAMIIPATIGIAVAPLYLLTTDYTTIAIAFSIQGAFAGAIYGINPSYANERFPTEITGDRGGVLLPYGRGGGRLRAANSDLFRGAAPYGLRDPDADRDGRRPDQLRDHAVLQSGNQGQGDGAGSRDPAAGGDAVTLAFLVSMPRVATFFVAWRALTSAEGHRHN